MSTDPHSDRIVVARQNSFGNLYTDREGHAPTPYPNVLHAFPNNYPNDDESVPRVSLAVDDQPAFLALDLDEVRALTLELLKAMNKIQDDIGNTLEREELVERGYSRVFAYGLGSERLHDYIIEGKGN